MPGFPCRAPGQAQMRKPTARVCFSSLGLQKAHLFSELRAALGRCFLWPAVQLGIQTLSLKSLQSLQSMGLQEQECE